MSACGAHDLDVIEAGRIFRTIRGVDPIERAWAIVVDIDDRRIDSRKGLEQLRAIAAEVAS